MVRSKLEYIVIFAFICINDLSTSAVYYIKASYNDTCPRSSCLTLNEFAATPSSERLNESLVFMSGEHILDQEVSLSNIDNISMTSDDGATNLHCLSPTGRFTITRTSYVSIKGLHFINCIGNTFSQVEQLDIEETTFQGMRDTHKALLLISVVRANIINTSFFNFSRNGGDMIHSTLSFSSSSLTSGEYVDPQRNENLTAGGALNVVDSNVSIIDCTFSNNKVDIGGSIFAQYTKISITGSIFEYNAATYGGAIVTAESAVTISNSTFFGNTADIGGVILAYNDSYSISTCTFSTNIAGTDGGVMALYNTVQTIVDSIVMDNSAVEHCGVMCAINSTTSITSSTYNSNSAGTDGGVIATFNGSSFEIIDSNFTTNIAFSNGGVVYAFSDCTFVISNSTFDNNRAAIDGGVLYSSNSCSFEISDTTFANNGAYSEFDEILRSGGGGVLYTTNNCSFNFDSCIFENNIASDSGGVIQSRTRSRLYVTSSIFSNNAASYGGVVYYNDASVDISNCIFEENIALRSGGVAYIVSKLSSDSLRSSISGCTFTHNTAEFAGALRLDGSNLPTLIDNSFIHNSADYTGGVMLCSDGLLSITNNDFAYNYAADYGGVLYTSNCSTHIVDCIFSENSGSLYVFDSNLTTSGYTLMKDGKEPPKRISTVTPFISDEGGAITSFQSTLTFTGITFLLRNQASNGGALLATESTIVFYGTTLLDNNTAINGSGGGISLKQSVLKIQGYCLITSNRAKLGGGIHVSGSIINVYDPGSVDIDSNYAITNGGGMYLKVNPKLNLLKYTECRFFVYSEPLLTFTSNIALDSGGAVYVADESNSGACSQGVECFVQSITLCIINFRTIRFSGNFAFGQASNIYGGLFDRCIPSPFAHRVLQVLPTTSSNIDNGFDYLQRISRSTIRTNTIASLPVRICFCKTKNDSEIDCSYQPPPIRVKKGESFSVPVVAVDQVNHTSSSNILSSLSSSEGGFGEDQQVQSVGTACTELSFNVFSPHDIETIHLYAEGPCGNAQPSTRQLMVEFLTCTCPIGFEPLLNDQSETNCQCVCDAELSPHITRCDSATSSLLRVDSNSWITYINDTDSPGYIIHPNCPFDYCLPPSEDVSFNFNLPEGADALCANNRRGVLCGACRQNFSLSLGSSRCLPCKFYWPGIVVVIIVAFIAAGILLVTALLALNMTVAVGLINSFIFYANILAAGSSVFFPSSEPSFPTVFIAWLNLDIGIDVCFFDGLDAYTKTWLQLAFPVYIISLVVVVIIVSEYSPKFAALIGKRDPIATLATLILLSYAKLLSVTITALSFANLDYPDGSRETVWLADGSVKYFQGKHIPLALVALLIILLGLPYTILLLFWQLIVRAPRWKIFAWTRNTKLNAFIAAYHVPNNSKCRYWTGLLLLVRVILYAASSITVSNDPKVIPLVTSALIGGLFLVMAVGGLRVYKNSFVSAIDTVIYFNLLALAIFSQYNFENDVKLQTAAVYTSTLIALLLLMGAVAYHIYLLTRQKKKVEAPKPAALELVSPPASPNEEVLPSEQTSPRVTTTTYVELLNIKKPSENEDFDDSILHHRKMTFNPRQCLSTRNPAIISNGNEQKQETAFKCS